MLAISGAITLAFADVHLAFDPPDGIIEGSGSLAVHVTVDAAATDLRGFSLVVAFDRTVVEVDSVYAEGRLVDAPCPYFLHWFEDASADSVAIDGAMLGCSTSGPGRIVTIVFRALPLSEGELFAVSPLGWRAAILRDSENATIPTIPFSGYILVVHPVSVEPATWGRTKAAFRSPEGLR
jgi:hypothetical protein